MNKFDYNKPKNGGYPYINNSSPSRQGGGAVINPTGTFTKVYLNCDATAADMEEVFGSIPESQWVTGSEWGIFENGYAAFCGELRGYQPDNAIIVLKNPLPSGKHGYVFMLFGHPKFERYIYSPEPVQEGSMQFDAGWNKFDFDDASLTPVVTPVSGVQEFDSAEPAVGRSYIESPSGSRYDVGLSNSKLTKILSFNEPFGSAAEDHELSYTNRDGIVDKDFRYDKPRNGGYPFTNIDGPTPADSTKFLNWTRRDDNDEPVPPGPQAPNYLKYSNDDPFMFKLVESNGGYSQVKSWDGEMQYAIGNEPGEDDWHTLEFVPGWSGISVRATDAADDGRYNIYLRANPDNPNTHILTTDSGTKTKFMTDSTLGPGYFLHVVVSGNIMALFNSTDPNSATLPTNTYALYGMFEDDSNIVDASGLVLPSVLADPYVDEWDIGCLSYMFKGCTSLTAAPELPATTLTTNCYYGMFQGCAELKHIPALPATTLANGCYGEMFNELYSLEIKKELEDGYVKWTIPSAGSVSNVDQDWVYGMFGSGATYEPDDDWLDSDGTPIFTDGVWTAYVPVAELQ